VKHLRVNDYDMAYSEAGQDEALVCVHGSLCDYRVWAPVVAPLSARHRVIAVSLRYFYPDRWDVGRQPPYTTAQHVADMIAFIAALGAGPVNLMGHSRGGHIAFRVAQRRPDLIRKLVLAEPGGDLDSSLAPGEAQGPSVRAHMLAAADRIAAGDIEGGLSSFMDSIEGPGGWRRLPELARQELRDNAMTLRAQVDEQRQPFSRADAESIRIPTLFIGGANTPGKLPMVLRALAAHVVGSQVVLIPHTTHMMIDQDPVRFSREVLTFLDSR